MKNMKRLLAIGTSLFFLTISGCKDADEPKPDTKPVSEYASQIIDRGVIGETGSSWGDAGVGIALGDMDGDGDLDIITVSPEFRGNGGIKYFENKIPQKGKK